MQKLAVTISTITMLCLVAIGFQNCAEEVNLDQYKSSEPSTTSTPTPPPNDSGIIVPIAPTPIVMPPAPATIPAEITSAPTSIQSVTFESPFTLAVVAKGTGTINYTWYKNNSIRLTDDSRITGTNTNTLRISKALESDAGTYSVEARNSYGSDSKSMTVQVTRTANQYPPKLASGGGLKDVKGGVSISTITGYAGSWVTGNNKAIVTFTITLSNTTNVAYQWFKVDQYERATLIPNQTGSTYSFGLGDKNYVTAGGKYRVVATNPYGSLTSEAVLHIETFYFTQETSF